VKSQATRTDRSNNGHLSDTIQIPDLALRFSVTWCHPPAIITQANLCFVGSVCLFVLIRAAVATPAPKMKSNPASDHVYFNDGFKCSTISISTNLTEPNGSSNSVGSQGSKEFIRESKVLRHLANYWE